jgi:hypothetical protein
VGKTKTALNLLGRDPKKIFSALGRNGFFKWIPDRIYLQILYYCETGEKLNLDKPETFNEKLQWIKLYDRKAEYVAYADKYVVCEYIAQTIGEGYLIPLIGVYENVEEILWDELPDKFVLKCTHGSGCNIICTDKSDIDIRNAQNKLNKWMKYNYYYPAREWCYRDIKPRIICEKYLVDESGTELKDYKFMCFNGEPKIIQVISERKRGSYLINHFDLEWNEINIPRKSIKRNPKTPMKPKNLNKMIEISKILSKDIPFVRIDLYETERGIYFGVITFFPVSGFMDFEKEEDDYLLGSWIKLSE